MSYKTGTVSKMEKIQASVGWNAKPMGDSVECPHETAVLANGLALEFVPATMKTFELCKLAVLDNGLALEFVPATMKTFELCKLAVKQDALALEFVPFFKRDIVLCREAVRQWRGLAYIPDDIRRQMKLF